jgi:hypothetical protein
MGLQNRSRNEAQKGTCYEPPLRIHHHFRHSDEGGISPGATRLSRRDHERETSHRINWEMQYIRRK